MTIDVTETKKRILQYPPPYLYIAGERRRGEDRETRTVVNPVTGEVIGHIPLATNNDLTEALEVTQQGFSTWSKMTAYERRAILHRAAQIMRQKKDEGALRISLELGKVFQEAREEIELAASIFEWTADEGLRAYGRAIPGRRPGLHLEARVRPVGPVYAVSSWNAPTNTPARKLSGALAAGCSVILKLSDQVPTSGLFIAEALEAAGLPHGVVQVVTGRGAHVSDTIIPNKHIRLVTLTGSVELGRRLASQAAHYLKPQTMELGGHAPAIIHRDVDPLPIARAAARAKFRNTGQVCTAPTRFIVHADIVEAFTREFIAETQGIAVGDPFQAGMDIGPLQSVKHLEEVEELVADARRRGAVVACGGQRLDGNGFFYSPTVLTEVPEGALVKTVEPFGPIASIEQYTDLDDAITEANSLSVGLSAYGFTTSGAVAERLTSSIRAGNIIINNWNSSFPETPFGGVGDSGYGREGGPEGLNEFLTTTFVSMEFPENIEVQDS